MAALYSPLASTDGKAHDSASKNGGADPYPAWIYGALLTPKEDEPLAVKQEGTEYKISSIRTDGLTSAQRLSNEEIRELLVDYVGDRCCLGVQPARRWNIEKVEDCYAYVGMLETFLEQRDVIEEATPYYERPLDGPENAYTPGPWEIDTTKEFPSLFVPKKTVKIPVPHSEVVKQCPDCLREDNDSCLSCRSTRKTVICSKCHGRGLNAQLEGSDTLCSACNGIGLQCPYCLGPAKGHSASQAPKNSCFKCYGRGLVAHADGSDTRCANCNGMGKTEPVKCQTCASQGCVISCKYLVVQWETFLTKKVIVSGRASSIPDEFFHVADGVHLYSSQCHQCQPVTFPDSEILSTISRELIAQRTSVPPTARILAERDQLTFIPVTRVTMSEKNKSFTFYILGLKKYIYLKGYPSACIQEGCTIL